LRAHSICWISVFSQELPLLMESLTMSCREAGGWVWGVGWRAAADPRRAGEGGRRVGVGCGVACSR